MGIPIMPIANNPMIKMFLERLLSTRLRNVLTNIPMSETSIMNKIIKAILSTMTYSISEVTYAINHD